MLGYRLGDRDYGDMDEGVCVDVAALLKLAADFVFANDEGEYPEVYVVEEEKWVVIKSDGSTTYTEEECEGTNMLTNGDYIIGDYWEKK